MSSLSLIFQSFFLVCMAWAATTDLLTLRIFNSLIIILLLGFAGLCILVFPVTSLDGWVQILWHFLAGLSALGLFLIFFAIGQMGAGDVKLIAVTALWFGWHPVTLQYVLYALLAGGILTLIFYFWRRLPISPRLLKIRFIKRLYIRKRHFPYGISLGITGAYWSFYAPIFS